MPPDEGIGPPLRCILLPVEDTSGVIQEFRIRFDPIFDKCPAHITVVFPFQSPVGKEKISEWMDLVCKNRLSFSLKTGPAQVADGWIFLPIKSQQKWLVEVHQKLSKKCGARPHPDFLPRVIIGRDSSGETDPGWENEIASERGKLPKSLHVNVTRLLLEEIRAEEVSHPLHESHFRIAD